jgi:uncharacterized delta-60 repeat protein
MRLKKIGIIIANLFCVFTFYINVHALPGGLDPTFDFDGKITTSIGDLDYAQDIAVQPDGKIVVIGYTQTNMTLDIDFSLARYNADGSLDPSFGTGGKVFFPESGDQTPNCLVIQPDGKILVVGGARANSSANYNAAAYRYNADGSFDTTFGNNGKIIYTFQNSIGSFGYDTVLQADGKIIIAGSLITPSGSLMFTFRLNADGSLDTSFNAFAGGGINSLATVVAFQNDGTIFVGSQTTGCCGGGHLEHRGSNGQFLGSVDVIFFPIEDIAVQIDGKIVVVGNRYVYSTDLRDFAIARYNPDLTLDTSFGNFGFNTVAFGNQRSNSATSVVVQPSGRIVVGGYAFSQDGLRDFALARFNSNGFLDVGFGNAGKVTTRFSTNDDQINAIAQQTDGKIVAVGSDNIDFAVARYDSGSSNTLANRTAFDYDGDGRADVSVLRPSTNTWYQLYSLNSSVGVTSFSSAGDTPAPADYDGDGRTDIAIYRPSSRTWWYLATSNNTVSAYFQSTGDADSIPRPSDYDGDGKADFVLYRPSDSAWSRIGTNSSASTTTFGIAEDKPLIGDFDGDGKSDRAVFRPSTGDWWYASSINGQFIAVHWGASGDIPAPGDYDGDGKTDFVVYRPSAGGWYILYSTGSYTIATFGLAEDKPVPADYDGDGKTDIAVFRPSTGVWYLLQTTAGFGAVQWGVGTDIPTENAFIP